MVMLQLINVGQYPNDNTGDKLRDAFIKVNDLITRTNSLVSQTEINSLEINALIDDVQNLSIELTSAQGDITSLQQTVNQMYIMLLDKINDAPIDGNKYIRQDGEWVPFSISMANNTELGLVKAEAKETESKRVVIDQDGFLFTESEIFRTSAITQSQSISNTLNGRHFLVQGNVTLTTVNNTAIVDFKNATFTITADSTLTFVAGGTTTITGNTTFSEGQTVTLLSTTPQTTGYRTVVLANENPNYKIVSSNVVLDNSYNNAIVEVISSVTITVPSGLIKGFNCVFDVTVSNAEATFISGSGATLNMPLGNKLRGNMLASLYNSNNTNNNYRLVGGLSN